MKHKRRTDPVMDLRLDPEARLCPAFDSVSVKKFAAPDAGEMPQAHIRLYYSDDKQDVVSGNGSG